MILLRHQENYSVETLSKYFRDHFYIRGKEFYNFNYHYALNIVTRLKKEGYLNQESVLELFKKHFHDLPKTSTHFSESYASNLESCLDIATDGIRSFWKLD